jgi:hypothetical protein
MSTTLRDQHVDLQYALAFFAATDHALHEEITAVRAQERREALPVRDGRREADPSAPLGDGVRYVFRTDAVNIPPVGERVRCVADGAPPLRAVVAGVAPGRVTLDLEADLGSAVRAATMQRDAAWLQEALRRRLAGVAEALTRGDDPAPYAHERALAVLRPGHPRGAPPAGFARLGLPDALLALPAFAALDEDQLEAVRRVLAQPTTFIWGPPGTGKTATLAAAVAALAAHGQRVLVVTPSNAAADVLLGQLHACMAEHPMIGRGVVQRLGAHVTAQLAPDLRDLFVPDAILRRLRDELDLVRAYLEAECAGAAARGEDVERWRAELADVAAERDALHGELAQRRLVTVTPVANAYLRPELWREYDAVVVDEASMIPAPVVALVAGLSRARVVVAGDWQQLGPVTVADTPAVRRVLGQDVFHAAGVPALVAAEDGDPCVVMLTAQYRMPSAVCALVSEDVYLDRLRTAHRRAPGVRLPFADGAVVLVDTSGLEPTVRRGGRGNRQHAVVVASLVDAIKSSGRGAAPTVGVYTLYREQVDVLRAAQRAPGRRAADVTATVHRAQGAEVDVAIVDLCDGPGAPPTFLRARTASEDGARLLTVAVTRAREALVVVANVPFLERAGGPVVRRLLARLRERGDVVDARALMA